MLTKIAGALFGRSIAKKTTGMNNSTGAMIGAAAPFVISRLSIPAMIVMGAGGYFAKRMYDKRKSSDASGSKASDKKQTDAKTASEDTSSQPDFHPAETRPNGAAAIAAQPVPAGTK